MYKEYRHVDFNRSICDALNDVPMVYWRGVLFVF